MISKLFFLLRTVVLLAICAGILFAVLEVQGLRSTPMPIAESGETLVVERGSGLLRVAHDLKARGFIDSPRALVWLARLDGSASSIQAGEYALEPGLTATGLIDKLNRGDVISHSLTIVEGWSFRQMRLAVAEHPALKQTLLDADDAAVMAALGHAGEHPEGRFFPSTYSFIRGDTDLSFYRQAYETMEHELAAAWAKRTPAMALKTPYEVLILASIIEKETGAAHERRAISGVFTRRLKKGMRLQTDPTVIYGMGLRYKGNIRRRDLREATPYNTYVISGMPPTPIALPGRAALEAAVDPEPGDALYFVSRNDGTHVFSATLAEHERAVDQYQRRRGKP